MRWDIMSEVVGKGMEKEDEIITHLKKKGSGGKHMQMAKISMAHVNHPGHLHYSIFHI